jgi:WD40-like Beta Propeller Repeat
MYLKDANGGQREKLIAHVDADEYPDDWSRDGKYLLYGRGPDLWFLTFPEMKSTQFLKTPSTLKNGHFSPDGKWVAYSSNESGKWEIYVTSFPEGRGKWQISNGGGEQPRWRGDGGELFYLSSDGKMMAVRVTEGANFDAGAPVALFQANPREPAATSEQTTVSDQHGGEADGRRAHDHRPELGCETGKMMIAVRAKLGLYEIIGAVGAGDLPRRVRWLDVSWNSERAG